MFWSSTSKPPPKDEDIKQKPIPSASSSSSSQKTPPVTTSTNTELLEQVEKKLEDLKRDIPTNVLLLLAFTLGLTTSACGAVVYKRYGRRIRNSDWITPDLIAGNASGNGNGNGRWIRGVVTSVGDADNFRFFHTPAFGGWRWPLKFRRVPSINKELKDQTIHIRIAGVDAPEAAHFGKPGQPYAAESLAWLRQTILGKSVYCQLIRRDQYSRIVANVRLPPRILPGSFFHGKSLPIEMLRAGWGTTYGQAGAEYGTHGKEEYLRVEEHAKAARRGMWARGNVLETPAAYKRRVTSSSSSSPTTSITGAAVGDGETLVSIPRAKGRGVSRRRGWFSRILGRK